MLWILTEFHDFPQRVLSGKYKMGTVRVDVESVKANNAKVRTNWAAIRVNMSAVGVNMYHVKAHIRTARVKMGVVWAQSATDVGSSEWSGGIIWG
jgi:hypothetical protein